MLRELAKKIGYKLVRYGRRYDSELAETPVVRSTLDRDSELRSRGMQFVLYAAQGGTIIETSYYDNKRDSSEHRLYIIPEGTDFTTTLAEIVSMERIKSWH